MQTHTPPDGAYSVTEVHAPRGTRVPPHVATREDLHLHVLDGRVLLVLDGETRELRAGDYVRIPRHVPRAVCVERDARLLWLSTPGGIERLASLVGDPEVDPDDAAAVCAAAGVTKLPRSLGNGVSPPDRPPSPPRAGSGS